jgi:hypothetical protein
LRLGSGRFRKRCMGDVSSGAKSARCQDFYLIRHWLTGGNKKVSSHRAIDYFSKLSNA